MTLDLSWWITAIEIPIVAFLFIRMERLADELARAKLTIAQTYVSRRQMRELEERMTAHLLRIERKLDATALQTAALKGKAHDR